MDSSPLKISLYIVASFISFIPAVMLLGSLSKNSGIIINPTNANFMMYSIIFISLIIFGSLVSLLGISLQKKGDVFKSVLLFMLLFFISLLYFTGGSISLTAISTLILSLGVTLLLLGIYNEKENLIEIRYARLIPRHVKHFFLAIGVVLSTTFYYSYSTTKDGFSVPESLLDRSAKGALDLMLKNVNSKVQKPLSEEGIGISLPSAENIPLNEGQLPAMNLLENRLKEDIKQTLNNMLDPYRQFIPAIISLGVFFTASTLFSFLSILSAPVSLFLSKIFLMAGVLRSSEEIKSQIKFFL